MVSPIRVLVIDNYDSFVYNLVQYLGELGAEPVVARNDQITAQAAAELKPDALLISPGPGRPEDSGASMDILRCLGRSVPTLGVCLGHQCIGAMYGGHVVRAANVMHGKTSVVKHDERGVFRSLEQPFEATRYHSLVVERSSVPKCLEITAQTEDGVIMGLRHRDFPVEGVQFHPESVLTQSGHRLMSNFLGIAASARDAAERSGHNRVVNKL